MKHFDGIEQDKIIGHTPYLNYQDNKVCQWLLGSVESVTGNDGLESLINSLDDGVTGDYNYLASLTPLNQYGLWDFSATDEVKKSLILNGWKIKRLRGTKAGITLAIQSSGYEASIFGDWITLPLTISPFSDDYLKILDIVEALKPATSQLAITYEHFYAGISSAGQPVI